MPAKSWQVDPASPDPLLIRQVGAEIRAGKLVAFPTETVYGLGANALDAAVVAKVFAAKGRPSTNPLIVHVAGGDYAREFVGKWTEAAQRLSQAFWPGPLTLVLSREGAIMPVAHGVTGGGTTVALRCPSHPVALALLLSSGMPITAHSRMAGCWARAFSTSAE